MTIIAQRSQYYRVPRYPASSASIPAKVAGDRLRRVLGVLVAAGAATNLSSLLAAGDSAAVDETLRSGIARRGIPAVVGMVASEHKRIYAGAFGKRDASGVPVHVDCIFAIASMTNAITTVAALQLVEQGK